MTFLRWIQFDDGDADLTRYPFTLPVVAGAHLRLVRGVTKPRTGFFLRAESYYNTATEIERLDDQVPRRPHEPAFAEFGGHNPHERSS